MSARSNRSVISVIGLLLLVGGGLSAALGAGAFGTARSDRDVFDPTVVRWWNEGGWESFAVVVVIGVVLLIVGLWMMLGQLQINGGRDRTPNVTFPDTERGETTIRSSALSGRLGDDLESIADVSKASAGLFGSFPSVEVRAVLTVSDDIALDKLPARVDEVLQRFYATTGTRPDPVHVTLRFKAADTERRLA